MCFPVDMEHANLSILEFGCLFNTSANPEEHAHKDNTKKPYQSTNKRLPEVQMTKILLREEAVSTVLEVA